MRCGSSMRGCGTRPTRPSTWRGSVTKCSRWPSSARPASSHPKWLMSSTAWSAATLPPRSMHAPLRVAVLSPFKAL